MSSASDTMTQVDGATGTSATASPSPATLTSATPPITSSSSSEHGRPTELPAMTTLWTKPATCTYTFDVEYVSEEGGPGPVAYLDLEPTPGASSLSCYPDGMFQEGLTGTFSPASCPNGWTTVSVRRNTDEPKSEATTTAVCCSSEFTYDGNFCKREPRTVLAVPIYYNTTAGTHDVLTQATSTLTSATLAVHAIKALFQQEDKEILGLTYDEEILDDELDGNDGLSKDAKIGIGVGVTIAGLLLIGLLTWVLLRKRKSRSRKGRGQNEVALADGTMGSRSGLGAAFPPLPYEYRERVDLPEEEADLGDSDHDGEIYALRAQKAAIQRRIEELERVENVDPPDARK